jgi:hypothetical protein
LFCQNYMDAKLVCQTVGVALSHPTYGNQTGPYSCVCFFKKNSGRIFFARLVVRPCPAVPTAKPPTGGRWYQLENRVTPAKKTWKRARARVTVGRRDICCGRRPTVTD